MKTILKTFAALAVCGAMLVPAACGEKQPQTPTTLTFAGDLQQLYGGEDGYPQAVLVAKKSVIDSDPAAVGKMISCFEGSAQFLASSEVSAVCALLQDKYTADMTPTLDANNLTEQVIANCSVRFTKSADCKERVNAFLEKLIAVDNSSAKTVSDAFYYTGTPAAGASETAYTVYAPDGAPALSLAYAISQTEGEAFEYRIVSATTITAQVTGETPAADFCVLPVNAAAKLLGTGEKYQMLGTVTNGNIYFLAAGEQLSLTRENLASALAGKTVGVVQLTNVPGLTFQAVLRELEIEYEILGNDSGVAGGDKVYLKPIADAKTGVTPAGGCEYYLCAEPVASAKVAATAK